MLGSLLRCEVQLVRLQVLWHQAVLVLAQPLPPVVIALVPCPRTRLRHLCRVLPHVIPVADLDHPAGGKTCRSMSGFLRGGAIQRDESGSVAVYLETGQHLYLPSAGGPDGGPKLGPRRPGPPDDPGAARRRVSGVAGSPSTLQFMYQHLLKHVITGRIVIPCWYHFWWSLPHNDIAVGTVP